MKKLLAALATGALMSASAGAQQAAPPAVAPISAETQRTVDRLQASALESDLGYDIVESLTTEVGPRLAGSEAEARARDWAVAMLRANGFTNVRIEPFTIPYWDATREEAHVISPSPQPLRIVALGGSPATPAGGVEAEIVRFTSMAELQEAPNSAVAGRIVFIDEIMQRTQDGSGYGVAVAKRGRCAPVAQPKGAAACLIRSAGTDSHRFPHQGGSSRQPDGASLPAAALSAPDADQLARLLTRGPVRVRINIEADIRDNAPSGNVIAEIRGREHPEEIVLLAAHLDSWDTGTGAIDDGAGVAIVTAAARLIQQLPRRPRRTIRLLLSGAEENGVHGGAEYARVHANETHIVAAESDFGSGRVWQFQSRFAEPALPYARRIQRALAPLGVLPGDNTAGGGADIGALRRTGVPVADLSQNGLQYFDLHHTPDDTLDKIDPADLQQNIAAYATFAYLVADSDWVFTPAP
ncbi:aminopeptidase [alpha proteobacterium U9-1i]|nr:aminopeptidase [alpha proteobacterium U9-1i]